MRKTPEENTKKKQVPRESAADQEQKVALIPRAVSIPEMFNHISDKLDMNYAKLDAILTELKKK